MQELTNATAPRLGFGTMRLPVRDGAVDMPRFTDMVDRFMAAGFTYFDTAYIYHDGTSEGALKKALVERYPRERFLIADKLAYWKANDETGIEDLFNEQKARLGVDFFDFYLLHSITEDQLGIIEKTDAWTLMHEKKASGEIRRFGISFHDTAEVLDGILSAHPEIEFVQLQINYADWESESVQSRLCYEICEKYDKPVIVMEPVRGGALAGLPQEARSLLLEHRPDCSVASWALRYAASLKNVRMVLSGMSDMEQLTDNMRTFSPLVPLNAEERATVARVAAILAAAPTVPCTACRYCTADCPKKIPIPGVLAALNHYRRFCSIDAAKGRYRMAVRDAGKASDCIGCKNCEKHCPQHIEISPRMREAAETFEKANA